MNMTLDEFYKRYKMVGILMLIPLSTLFGLSTIAMLCYLLTDFLYAAYTILYKQKKVEGGIFFAQAACLAWMVLVFTLYGFKGSERIIQFLCLILTVYVVSTSRWSKRDYVFMERLIQFQILLYILWWPISGFTTNYYSAFYTHSNNLGNLLLHYIVLLLVCNKTVKAHKSNIAAILMAVLVLLWSNSRASLVAVTVLFGCYWVLSKIKYKNAKRLYFILLVGVVCVAVGFTVLYPNLYGTDLGTTLELLSRQYLNKNFFSGREIIWKNIEEQIVASPFLGWGLDKVPSFFYDTGYSSHNLWLQVALQMGIVGVIFLSILILTIQSRIARGENPLWRISASFFAALILHECFEVSLTQNNLAVGLASWFIFGIMLSERRVAWESGDNEKAIDGKRIIAKVGIGR